MKRNFNPMKTERRVLIVDDDFDFGDSIADNLKSKGYFVRLARTIPQAEKIITQFDFQITLVDIRLGRDSGISLIFKLSEKRPEILKIIMTAYADTEAAIEALKGGACDFLRKPFHPQELFQTLERCYEKIQDKLDKEATQELLAHANRMTSLGTLVAGIGHEINNPNNFVMMNAPLLEEIWRDSEEFIIAGAKVIGEKKIGGLPYKDAIEAFPKLITSILNGSRRIKEIVLGLREYSLMNISVYKEEVNIEKAIDSAENLLSGLIKKSTYNFQKNIEKTPPVLGNPQKLEQVIVNLLSNACHSLADKVQALRINVYYDRDRDLIIIEVKDEGKGMGPETLEKIMDPFFTTKQDSGGTGLGISISYGIIKDHGGMMEYTSELNKGTTVTITLPVKK